ncbi:MAG: VOC family protein [Chitinophagaceae bacterium]|nr:VOC family protein [Chitinophagaceae bacterium]
MIKFTIVVIIIYNKRMGMAAFPNIECQQVFPTLQVSDIYASLEFYTQKLGFSELFVWGEPIVFAGVRLDKTTLHLALVDEVRNRSVVNFVVNNANELYQVHQSNNVKIVVPIDDREYGLRDYQVEDPDGNLIGFGHYIYNQGPAVKIERVEVAVRLEKRLAALLQDLAVHKGTDLSAVMEETFLHTFEKLGDSVASPHTEATLDYIQELKKKHGIDYDTHASYRFVE